MKARIKIDDKEIVSMKGATILEAALENGIYIPHLCFHHDLEPTGVCRLCIVEVDGEPKLSCKEKAMDGAVIRTRTPEIDSTRKMILELLVADNHGNCKGCPKRRSCQLLKVMAYVKPDREEARLLGRAREELPRDTSNPFFDMNPNRCVLCGLCVKTCEEIMAIGAIDFSGRAYKAKVSTLENKPIIESGCISCGECVKRCPTAGLYYKTLDEKPEKEEETTCPFCSFGCRVGLGVRQGKLVSSRGELLCGRGRFGWSFVHSKERILSPLSRIGGELREVSWNEALDEVAENLRRNRGKTAVLVSATCTNEEGYLAQKFSRDVLGSNNIDNTSRISDFKSLMAVSYALGGMVLRPFDIEGFSSILVAGSDVTKNNPIAGVKIKEAVRKGSKLILVDPKETDLLRFSDAWLRPYPGTDSVLFMGMAKFIFDEGLFDSAFAEECEGFDEFKKALEYFPIRRVERITGVPTDSIEKASETLAKYQPSAFVWSAGITDYAHGERSVYALTNLSLLVGNAEGMYALLGESNTKGICDMGCLPEFHPGWKSVDETPKGLSVESLWDAILDGAVKALYLIGVNPLEIQGSHRVREALRGLDFLVVQDLFLDGLLEFAHAFLPSSSFAEKDGTLTNFEGKVQRIRKVLDPLGESLPGWLIISRLATEMGGSGFGFESAEDVMKEMKSVVPFSSSETKTPKFLSFQYEESSERTDIDYPLMLVCEKRIFSGKLLEKADGFDVLRGDDHLLRVNPKDAMDLGMDDGEEAKVVSRYGEVQVTVKITDAVPPGVTYLYYEPDIGVLFSKEEPRICSVRIARA